MMKIIIIAFLLFPALAQANDIWMELRASNKWERTALVQKGFDIVSVEQDRVVVLGDLQDLQKAQSLGILLARYKSGLSPFDFPVSDEKFHNSQELQKELEILANQNPQIVEMSSIGESTEKRQIWSLRLSAKSSAAGGTLPAAIFMGGHHAREHVSVEVPLRLAQYLVQEYNKKNPRIVSLFNTYEIYIIPSVNPDGKEFDVSSANYQMWRKNRGRNKDGSYGVDLNRNYGYGWGGAGASTSTQDETYRGPSAFSEPETQAIKKFIEQKQQITTLLSYHTYSQLVLWPWGHDDADIANEKDLQVFTKMGKKMASWNGYKPMKSGDLYLASGDTCDWAYGEHGIFAFTFELDPKDFWSGGFYPGQSVIDSVFQKNLEPALYMIEASDNPYKVL